MKVFYTFLFCLFSFYAHAETVIYFTPSKDCENQIIEQINQAKHTIDAAIYAINNDNIVEALKRAFDKGVKIRILTDRLQASSKYSKARELYHYGINIKVHSKYKIEHNKFAVFDSEKVVSGSYNWTNAASDKNSENCIFFIQEVALAKIYRRRFRFLWRKNSSAKSKAWFNK